MKNQNEADKINLRGNNVETNKDLYEQIKCPLCGSIRSATFRSAADIVKCLNCETVYLRTRFKKEVMEKLYQSYNSDAPQMFLPKGKDEIKNSPLRRDGWIREILEYTRPEGNILDIGCGWGAFLDNARNYGLNPRGIEITKKGTEFAEKELKIEATSKQFLDTPLANNSFNIVTLNHVLEHLPEPKQALEKIFNVLEPGGLLCGIVPNINSFCSVFMENQWEWLDADYHYVHYSPDSLKNNLEKTGYIIEKIYTASGDYNRDQLRNTINRYYRPNDNEHYKEIVEEIEKAGMGEEIRFIVRKPLIANSTSKELSDIVFTKSKQKVHKTYTSSIIIPVYNKVEFTQKCLEAIYSTNCELDNFQVIVVDNASTDTTGQFLQMACEEYSDLKIIHSSQNLRFARACNLGAKNADGDVLVFLNNDTVPEENWLSCGVNKLMMDESIGIVGAKLIYPDRTIQHAGVEYLPNVHPDYSLWPIHRFLGMKEDDPLVNKAEKVEAITGACLFIQKKLFNKIDGFDEEYGMYFEDMDLCFKVLKTGKSIYYEPEISIIHYEGKSTPDEATRYKMSEKAAKRFFNKWDKELTTVFQSKNQNNYPKRRLPFSIAQQIEMNKGKLYSLIQSFRYTEANKILIELKKHIPDDPFIEQTESFFLKLYSNQMKKINSLGGFAEKSELFTESVSIIVLTHNALEYTKKFSDSLNESTNIGYELLMIDNASDNETKKYLKTLEKDKNNVKVTFNDENIGFPAGVNKGLQQAKGKYIILVNNDVILTKGWLERMVKVADLDSKIGIVGPISNAVSGVQLDSEAKYNSIEEMHQYAKYVSEMNNSVIEEFPRVAFLCTLIKREVIDKIGGLDERFSPGNFEDDDFCLRAQLAGYKTVIAKDVFIHHYGSVSFKQEGESQYANRLKINEKKFIDKWGSNPEGIWLKGEKYNDRSIIFPIDEDIFNQSISRAFINIDDHEYDFALDNLKLGLDNFNNSSRSRYQNIKKEDFLNIAANLALSQNNLEDAKSFFEKELEINSTSSKACFGLGEVFLKANMFEESKTMLEWAVVNDNQNQNAQIRLKEVNLKLNLPQDHNSILLEEISVKEV